MTDQQIHNRIKALAEELESAGHLDVAGVLWALAGSLSFGHGAVREMLHHIVPFAREMRDRIDERQAELRRAAEAN